MRKTNSEAVRAQLLTISRDARELSQFIVDAQTGRYDLTYPDILSRVGTQARQLAEKAEALK